MTSRAWMSLLVPVVVALDLAAKAWARAALIQGEPVPIAPFFDLTLSYNRGVAFGFLNAAGVALVSIVTAAITIVFGAWFWHEPNPVARLGLALIVGGAIGNLVDRLWRGTVTDFLDVHVGGLHWPTFNLADSALTVGVIVLLVSSMRSRQGVDVAL